MIIHSSLLTMKNIILPNCLLGNYRDSLREFRIYHLALYDGIFIQLTSCSANQNAERIHIKASDKKTTSLSI